MDSDRRSAQVERLEVVDTGRRRRWPYKTRVRMPSKLDPHIAAIEGWLAEQPQLTALAIVSRLSETHPEEFRTRQHSIVQRLLRALRQRTAEQLVAEQHQLVEPACKQGRRTLWYALDQSGLF